MTQMIFLNLPVTDVARATAFYEAMGAEKNEQFSNDEVSSMCFSDTIVVMLLSHAHFGSFSPKPIADPHAAAQMLICLSAESREHVDAWVEKAGPAGGKVDPCTPQDHGFMYGRSFEDPDGHIYEVMWMDLAAAQAAMQPQAA